MSKGRKKNFVIGIDEAGRGPLAGPVAVAAVAATAKFKSQISNLKILKGIRDSKKLSAKQREKWAEILRGKFECHSVMMGAKIIDKIGIQKATRLAVARVLRKFQEPCGTRPRKLLVLLDGSLFAPNHYSQKTIIRGDEKIPLISAASIIAKTRRDGHMLCISKKFPRYCFDKHKGYATKLHYKMLKKYGPSPIHRSSFLH